MNSSNIKLMPMDIRLEAQNILTRMTYTESSEGTGDMRCAAEHYMKKYEVDADVFAPLIEAYEYVKANLEYNKDELITLFGIRDDLLSNVAQYVDVLKLNLPAYEQNNCQNRMSMLTFEYSDETPDNVQECTDVSQFVDFISRLSFSADTKWLLVDLCVNYDDYAKRIDALIDKAGVLLSKKAHLLEPYINNCIAQLEKSIVEGSFFSLLESNGLKLDINDVVIMPNAIMFSMIALHGNLYFAKRFSLPERLYIQYGALVDSIGEKYKKRVESFESRLAMLHVLDDKSRFQVLIALKERSMCGQDIAELTGLSPGTVSHHMCELANKGFVTLEKQGVRIIYSQNSEKINAFLDSLKDTLT